MIWQISIHALREEGDLSYFLEKVKVFYFYPRPPRGGRQYYYELKDYMDTISIHALREEGDKGKWQK